jgi:hypothetical protein
MRLRVWHQCFGLVRGPLVRHKALWARETKLHIRSQRGGTRQRDEGQGPLVHHDMSPAPYRPLAIILQQEWAPVVQRYISGVGGEARRSSLSNSVQLPLSLHGTLNYTEALRLCGFLVEGETVRNGDARQQRWPPPIAAPLVEELFKGAHGLTPAQRARIRANFEQLMGRTEQPRVAAAPGALRPSDRL